MNILLTATTFAIVWASAFDAQADSAVVPPYTIDAGSNSASTQHEHASYIWQDGAPAQTVTLTQSGNINTAGEVAGINNRFQQENNRASATIVQHNGAPVSISQASVGVISIGSASSDSTNATNVWQQGADHNASVAQNGDSVSALVRQSGAEHRAAIATLGATQSDASIRQKGARHVVGLDQVWNSLHGVVTVFQRGASHMLDAIQRNILSGAARVTKLHSENRATVTQVDGIVDSIINVVQTGSHGQVVARQIDTRESHATVSQNGFDHVVRIAQPDGFGLDVSVFQRGGYHSTAGVTQTGDHQQAQVQQYLSANGDAGIVQSGSNNDGNIIQNKVRFSTAGIEQDGRANSAEAAQSGVEQQSEIMQTGSANIAQTWQAGSNNSALIRQASEASGNVGAIWQSGTGFNAVIAQTGSANRAAIRQY
jgi:hypothetical protein